MKRKRITKRTPEASAEKLQSRILRTSVVECKGAEQPLRTPCLNCEQEQPCILSGHNASHIAFDPPQKGYHMSLAPNEVT